MNPIEAPSVAADGRLSSDDRLESLLVHLVGQLEQQMTMLERTEHVKRMISTIEGSLSMLVTIIDTGLENHGSTFFSHDLHCVRRLREQSKAVLHVLDRESWSSHFGFNPKAKSTTLTTYRSLGKQFVQMFRDLFARFGEEFQSPLLRDDFHESYSALLEEFSQRF